MNSTIRLSRILIPVILAILVIGLPATAQAVEIEVTTTEDATSGACSLRLALENANQNALINSECLVAGSADETDVITFGAALGSARIELDTSLGELELTDDLAIRATNRITISGMSSGRVFSVASAVNAEMTNLAIVEGEAGEGRGGGISVGEGASLTLIDSALTDNDAILGGAIYNTGDLTLTRTTLARNSADEDGGAIYNYSEVLTATVTLVDSNLISNTAERDGGGIFNIAGASSCSSTSGIARIVLTGGLVEENVATDSGGGIYSLADRDDDSSCGSEQGTATVSITDADFDANRADQDGGALYFNTTNVEIIDSTFTANRATGDNNDGFGDGGAIYRTSGAMTITGSEFVANTASTDGGAILTIGEGTIVGSTLADNQAGREGGGIYHLFDLLTVDASTVSGNWAGQEGGGLQFVGSGTDTNGAVINSTISGNRTDGDGAGIYAGCSECIAAVEIRNSTIVNNVAEGFGGGLDIGSGDIVTLSNTIVAGNQATDGGVDCAVGEGGDLITDDHNLFDGEGDGCQAGPSDLLLDDLGQTLLDVLNPSLQDNGGPTLTHALIPDSPAVDAGNLDGCAGPDETILTTDQRGEDRPQGIVCDIGAFESPFNRPEYTITLTANPMVLPIGLGTTLQVTVRDQAGNPGAGVTVDIRATGANSFSASPTTDGSGTATVLYDQGMRPGTDVVVAWIDLDGDQSPDSPAEPSASVDITWQPLLITLDVSPNEQLIGRPVEVEATVVVSSPLQSLRVPVPGLQVGFLVDGGDVRGTAITDDQGRASLALTYVEQTEEETETEDVTAWVDLNRNGVLDVTTFIEPESPTETITWRGITISFRGVTYADLADGVRRQVTASVSAKGPGTPILLRDYRVGFMVSGGTIVDPPQFDMTDENGQADFFYDSLYPDPAQILASALHAPLLETVTTWVDLNEDDILNVDSSGDPVEPQFNDPAVITWVQLLSLTVERQGADVVIHWRTGVEVDNAGFNLYRALSPDGPYTRINQALIAGQGTGAGADYAFADTPPDDAAYVYRLEDVDYNGISRYHGPVSIGASLFGEQTPHRLFLPLIVR